MRNAFLYATGVLQNRRILTVEHTINHDAHESTICYKPCSNPLHLRFLGMFTQVSLVLSLALLSAASPLAPRKGPKTVPLARKFNIAAGTKIADVDQARAKALSKAGVDGPKAEDGVSPVSVTNTVVVYTAEVCVVVVVVGVREACS